MRERDSGTKKMRKRVKKQKKKKKTQENKSPSLAVKFKRRTFFL